MQEKDIKRIVIKQLKTKFPFWRRLTKKPKKALVEKALNEVMASYQPSQAMHMPLHELTNLPASPADIIPLSEMGKKVKTTEHVDPDRRHVFMDDYCETPVRYLGTTKTGHEFGCDAGPQECFQAPRCPQCRELPFDSGQFGQLPDVLEEVD